MKRSLYKFYKLSLGVAIFKIFFSTFALDLATKSGKTLPVKSRLSLIVRMDIVLNRTVVIDSD